jgi:DNA-binding NarL/FixJ family response regulator
MINKNIVRVVIVEDDDIIRNGFATIINGTDKFLCIASYDTCEEAIKNLSYDTPQIILMDIRLPGISGIEGIRRIKNVFSKVDIIVLTIHEEDEQVFDALCAGGTGYLAKNTDPENLIASLEEVIKGGAPMSTNIAKMVMNSVQKSTESLLTKREIEVLQKFVRGKSYTVIGHELFINKETVRTHIKNIYQKLPYLIKTSQA